MWFLKSMNLYLMLVSFKYCSSDRRYFREFCGCIEPQDLVPSNLVISQELDPPYDMSRGRCDLFCSGHDHNADNGAMMKDVISNHFVITRTPDHNKFICNCFTNILNIFDCDEEEREDLIGVHCTSRDYLNFHHMKTMADTRPSKLKTLTRLQEDMKEKSPAKTTPTLTSFLNTGNGGARSASHHSSTTTDVNNNPVPRKNVFGTMALILTVCSIAGLILLAMKTYIDYKKKMEAVKKSNKKCTFETKTMSYVIK